MSDFRSLGLKEELLKGLEELGFTSPTPIQSQAIPVLLEKTTDFVGLAQTGTGKTAAFGLPLLHHIQEERAEVQALVLCPTRELCLQITGDLKTFSKYISGFHVLPVYGGSSIDTQIKSLKKGVQVVVATPGRLIDLIERKAINLNKVQFVVLDEADEMLNMGFREDIDYILSQTVNKQSAWLFSATMPNEVRSIAKRFMDNPKEVSVGKSNTTAANINHVFYVTQASFRYEALRRIIDVNPGMYAIIFCRTKKDTQDVAHKLQHQGYDIDALHGDLTQQQRDRVMGKFRDKTLQLLIATDVAARGIDVDNITHVINYELPEDAETYTHRSGRTARAGKKGTCISIIHSKENRKIHDIERMVKAKFEQQQLPSGLEVCRKQFEVFTEKLADAEVHPDGMLQEMLPGFMHRFDNIDKEELLMKLATLEMSRLFDYYKNAKDLNKTSGGRDDDGRFKTLFCTVGMRDGLYKADLLQMLLDNTGYSKEVVGRIDLKDTFSFVDVDANIAEDMVSKLQDITYNGRKVKLEISTKPASGGGRGEGRDRGRRRDGGRGERRDFGGGRRDSGGRRDGGGGSGKKKFYGKNR